ncbi:uncharacterized protein LOC130901213 isoform X1 [Diorhabda carinulata]|uniref:uncharacterized protein LOC130901213 isoform X1 n=1 Tax=Diorhabda carinulata TaxID=1163345 RepID=UPI0025A06DD4|nr:uncharacterized protein LOC130901213 isoform X1 [Diorhabda carinulata]XP_057668395.1 uncharacterized protein LOC130901213 isoform X1 [Diorhabda carinulata]XP_057668396.1 uncharacterized protein LOC130901213 isoform X1 [Diorhabda carinulata]XP_057668397.1 uncharacterized protein LOC130901213 isoform X1 [Diorhabda carinulata]XP_057668398.1 uncharacterized protein LOC130901213 isoform X1 [Diorhabda carinulata]XP_057668399.1 uncharacterized protein LOC130901213 isoform X1 [Diorhabda carinulata]
MDNEVKPELDEVTSPENVDSTSQPDCKIQAESENFGNCKPSSVANDNQTHSDKNLDDSIDQTNSKKSRELKSLLALSKEANLKTNISHKRKKDVKDSYKGQSDIELKKSSKVTSDNKQSFNYPVTAEAELEEIDEEDDKMENGSHKLVKRKRDRSNESMDKFLSEDGNRKNKKAVHGDVKVFKPNKDAFCWRCHREGVNVVCETCPRSYHQKCLKQTIMDVNHWPCPECVAILKAESTQTRSPAMKGMTLEHLCSLLKFAVNRMMQCQGSEPFLHPVSEDDFPDYRKYIIQPMDLTLLGKNIKDNVYGSTQAFEADAKWLLHNSIIYNSSQSKLTSAVKSMIKICKQEMMEIENCPSCYLKANVNKSTWFVEVCPKPHMLVWAKLKGFPYWPAKAMSINSVGMVDVRFFGAHDRAWVHWRDCYLYSEKDPNTFKQKRFDIEKSVEELNVYIENLKKIYGEFRYAPFRTQLDPENMSKQLIIFLPKYKSIIQRRRSLRETLECKQEETTDSKSDHIQEKSEESDCSNSNVNSPVTDNDTTMEGYGTDDDMQSELDLESRKAFSDKKVLDGDSIEDEEDLDDTQVPSNVSADTTVPKGKIKTRGNLNNSIGKLKMLPRRPSENHLSEEALPITKTRRNSDQSVKSDSSRISNISDKINRVNISENMEITLGNDDLGCVSILENMSPPNGESSRSESECGIEIKKKPIQVDINNAEFSISPNKLKISDQLIKRLTDVKKIEEVKSKITELDSPVNISQPSTSNSEKVDLNGDINSSMKEKNADNSYDLIDLVDEKQKNLKIIQPSIKEFMTVKEKCNTDSKQEVDVSISNKNHEDKVNTVEVEDMEIDSTENIKDSSKQQNVNNTTKVILDEKRVNEKLYDHMDSVLSVKPSSSEKEENLPEKQDIVEELITKKIINTEKQDTSEVILVKNLPGKTDKTSDKKGSSNTSNQNVINIIEEYESDEEDEEEDTRTSIQVDKQNIFDVIHSSLKDITLKEKNKTMVSIGEVPDNNSGTKETKKRKLPSDEQQSPAKLVKIVSIESILNRKDEEDKLSNVEKQIDKKIMEYQSAPVSETGETEIAPEDIKSEPESDYEMIDDTYNMEEKRKYLSALNIHEKTVELEKKEKNEIRTRSKAEEKRERFKVVDNLTRIIDDVAVNYSATHGNGRVPPKKPERRRSSTNPPAQEGEIYVKSFAKLHSVPANKQRARKTFPSPCYFKGSQRQLVLRKEVSLLRRDGQSQKYITSNNAKSATTTIEKPTLTIMNPSVRTTDVNTTSVVTPIITSTLPSGSGSSQVIDSPAPSIVPPTSLPLVTQPSLNLIHNQKVADSTITIPHQSMAMGHVIIMPSNYCAPILSTVTPTPALTACPPLHQTQTVAKTVPNLKTSQNYIPHNDEGSESPSPPAINSLNDFVNQQPTTTKTSQQQVTEITEPVTQSTSTSEVISTSSDNPTSSNTISNESHRDEEFSVLNGLIPESVSKAVSDLLLMPPPRLKPRPPGIISQHFEEGIPSTAGDVTSRINSIAHRMTDYFRGMLIESLGDLAKTNNPEATILSLKLEIETIKHRHSVEMAEIRKNMCSILKDVQRSIIEERTKIIDETRASCEAETIRRVEAAKSKQWCANCPKEAQFYCCWNTSYCDYPCQQKHWPQHAGKCTQSIEKTTGTGAIPPARTGPQPIVLRPSGPPKPGVGRFITKPTKVYMNRAAAPQKNVKSVPTSTLTLVETTPGNYEILGNGSIGIAGKIFTSTNSITTTKSKGTTVGTSTVTTDSIRPTSSTSSRTQH